MLGFMLYTPILISQGYEFSDEELILDIRGFPPLSTMQIAQALKSKSHTFYKVFMARDTNVPKDLIILVNMFSKLEALSLDTL